MCFFEAVNIYTLNIFSFTATNVKTKLWILWNEGVYQIYQIACFENSHLMASKGYVGDRSPTRQAKKNQAFIFTLFLSTKDHISLITVKKLHGFEISTNFWFLKKLLIVKIFLSMRFFCCLVNKPDLCFISYLIFWEKSY